MNLKPKKKRHHHHRKPLWKRQGFYALILGALFSLFGGYWLLKFRILPGLITALIIEFDVLVLVLVWYLMIRRHRRWKKVVGWILTAFLVLSNGLMGYYFNATWSALDKMTENTRQTGDYVELDVLADSVIESVDQMNGRTIGVLSTMDSEQKDLMVSWLDEQGIDYELKEYDSSLLMARNLKGAVIDGIILYQPYLSVIESYEGMEGFGKDIRTIHQIPCKAKPMAEPHKVDVTKDPFTILISGIDTYGKVTASGRSDVNMLMSVNPTTRSILLISIPRDYYVEVDCPAGTGCEPGVKDKLTHTGIYGVEATQKSLEKLFDITINYDIRINFDSVIQVINALGGIEVNNVDTFTMGKYSFEPGVIHMDGEMALSFARERYAFAEGDRERGRNQMRVVDGIIRKALSPSILENYTSVLNAAADSIQMNLSVDDIARLVSMQLSHPSGWNVYTYSVSGSDATEFAPALGDKAYVMIPDEDTVKNAMLDLQAMLVGETPLYVTQLGGEQQ